MSMGTPAVSASKAAASKGLPTALEPTQGVAIAQMPEDADPRRMALVVNVGHCRWILDRTHGRYVIPPCLPTKDEETGAIIPAPRYTSLEVRGVRDRISLGDYQFIQYHISGGSIALDIAQNLQHYGVFIAAKMEPSETELRDAEQLRDRFYTAAIEEADASWGQNGKPSEISTFARVAARTMGLDKPWLHQVADTVDCEYCGEKVRRGVAICKHCNAILDHDKYERGQASPQELAGRAKRSKPSKKNADDAAEPRA